MSDRLDLEEYKERIAECEDDWLGVCPSEFIERCADLVAEIDRLRANKIPGRCGECERFKPAVYEPSPGETTVPRYWCYLTGLRDPKGFCHEWKPKE